MTTSTSQIKSLDEILAYRNEAVIARFSKMYPDAVADAELIFDDLKRFLWLVATTAEKRKNGADLPDISFSGSMIIIDEMWHAFILLTEYYADFCEKYLHQFIHHPTAMDKFLANKEQMSEDEAAEIFLREMIEITHDTFGAETTERWFDYYFKYQRK